MKPSRLVTTLAALLLLTPAGQAAVLGRLRNSRTSNISLRKRLHVNTLITEPGTLEMDWNSVYSFSTTNFDMPSTIKYTPAGGRVVVEPAGH